MQKNSFEIQKQTDKIWIRSNANGNLKQQNRFDLWVYAFRKQLIHLIETKNPQIIQLVIGSANWTRKNWM